MSTQDLVSAFGKFNDLLEKKAKGHVKLKGFSDITEFIPTGNFMLNALMSGSLFGGYPNARSIGISGDSGCVTADQVIKVYQFKNPELVKANHSIKTDNL